MLPCSSLVGRQVPDGRVVLKPSSDVVEAHKWYNSFRGAGSRTSHAACYGVVCRYDAFASTQVGGMKNDTTERRTDIHYRQHKEQRITISEQIRNNNKAWSLNPFSRPNQKLQPGSRRCGVGAASRVAKWAG